MNDQQDVVERLTKQLDLAAHLRESAQADAELEATRQRLRAWQAVRLARTHADLLASPSMGPAATFFLTDLYGSKDLTRTRCRRQTGHAHNQAVAADGGS